MMSSTENEVRRIMKVELRFKAKSGEENVYEQEGLQSKPLEKIVIPFSLNLFSEPEEFQFVVWENQVSQETISDYDYFKFIVKNEGYAEDKEKEYQMQKRNSIFAALPEEYFELQESDFPKMNYCDITEQEMFGYDSIPANTLLSENVGLWADNGLRKLEININGLDEQLHGAGQERNIGSDEKIKAAFYWDKIEGVDIPKHFEEKIRYNEATHAYFVFLNTNKYGALMQNQNTDYCKFQGRFTLHVSRRDYKFVYSYPVEICFYKTDLNEKGKNKLIVNNPVSIDFGTSSTCAAVKSTGGARLFTLSGNGKLERDAYNKAVDNKYENPTNVLIYNWDELYKQWSADNHNLPYFVTKSNSVSADCADYDSGYTVQDVFQEVDEEDGRRKMRAILTQLKMIPYLLQRGVEKKVYPYKGEAVIKITDTIGEESESKFNPIAFYGYLLGRAINNPSGHKIYTKYNITYPVKFDNEVTEKIRTSLEYGIKRALPKKISKGVNQKGKSIVSVQMENSEPVACIGAFVGKQLKLGSNSAEKFAVYDLGGGTMDFVYGVFRKANEEEIEEYESDSVIEILGLGGDSSIGGEKLIHKLAYKIYKDSRENIEENRIPFALPEGELNPDGFDGLIRESYGADDIADANVNILKEKLAAKLFKFSTEVDNNMQEIFEEAQDANHVKFTLKNVDNEEVPVELTVAGIDEFLETKIRETVANFAQEMDTAFSKEFGGDYHRKDVHIFLAGNASKQKYVSETMEQEEFFKEADIQRIGKIAAEEGNQDGLSAEYKINEKTAVAFGQLNLSSYYIDDRRVKINDDLPPFQYHVGYLNPNNNEFVCVIAKNTTSQDWVRANPIDKDNECTQLEYTGSSVEQRESFKPLQHEIADYDEDDGKSRLYLRINSEDTLEYRLGTFKEGPQNDEAVDESKLIKLK